MKKYIIMISMFLVGVAHASVMCSDSDYVTLVLDPSIEGISYPYNAANMTWNTVFPYGNVSGVAVCNDTGGTYAVASNDEQTETGGVKCWCKMTHPAVSRWVFSSSGSSSSDCSDYCARNCGNYVRALSDFRSRFFGSVAN